MYTTAEDRAILVGLGWTPPEDRDSEPVSHDFFEIVSDEYTVDKITIEPFVEESGALTWELGIPDTSPSPNEPPDVVLGITNWDTLEGAVLSLLFAVRQGKVKFNDGRIAS